MAKKINPSIFRAYDVRGLVDNDLTEETVELLGKGIGTYMQKASGNNIVVGGDNRASTETFRKALIAGLVSTGCTVTDIGVSMTPMLWFANYYYKFDGGVQITGSHNPIEFNGFKMSKKGIDALFGDEIQEIKKIIDNESFKVGQGLTIDKDVFDDYLREIKKRININRKIKAVVDCGNGTGSTFIPKILREIGLDVVELYCESDPTFPNHLPDPEEEENVKDLMALVKKEKADVGLAFDGDCDRIGIINEKGERYEADELMLILARDLLSRKPGGSIVGDVKYSQVIIDEVAKAGGKLVLWKTGYPNIKNKMTELGSLLAGEVSGHMFLKEAYFGFDDATFACLKILEILTKQDKPFSSLLADLPEVFSTPEIKLPTSDDKKFEIVEKITEHFKKEYPESILVDGIRIQFGNGAWALVRCSNTNPYLTVRIEAKDQATFSRITEIVKNKLAEYSEIDISGL